jgi:plasmid maintenance system antidote protein VapI
MDCINLRGAVMSKYKTIGEFANEIGWNRNKASRIVNGVQDPDIEDIQKITKVLGIESKDVFLNIFFSSLSTLWTQ